jgi:hypothetical protein
MNNTWKYFAAVTFWCSAALAIVCVLAQIMAFNGHFFDQPFSYLIAAFLLFIAGGICFLKLAKDMDPKQRRRFGWQIWVILSRASFWTVLMYFGSIAYLGLMVFLSMPSNGQHAVVEGHLRNVLFPTCMALFVTSANLATCSAYFHSSPPSNP